MAENRINQALENIANGEPFDNPRTDDEVMLSKIAAGEEVTENSRNRFQYWLKRIEVGGNPNYVEKIEGTVANPWGAMTPYEVEELRVNVLGKRASVIMSVKVQQANVIFYLQATGANSLVGSAAFYNTNPIDLNEAYKVEYNAPDARLEYIYATVGGASLDYTQYAAALPATLTIIHHPLPR